jgi:hypothetical protein
VEKQKSTWNKATWLACCLWIHLITLYIYVGEHITKWPCLTQSTFVLLPRSSVFKLSSRLVANDESLQAVPCVINPNLFIHILLVVLFPTRMIFYEVRHKIFSIGTSLFEHLLLLLSHNLSEIEAPSVFKQFKDEFSCILIHIEPVAGTQIWCSLCHEYK